MRVVSGLNFFPRGGSAHVARALARHLPAHGVDVTLVSGSVDGGHGDARAFYRGLDVVPVVFGRDAPMHPSFEDRPGAPDPVLARLSGPEVEEHAEAWARALARAGAADADVLHLHHLTPLQEAARRVAPGVPVVGHLHGTELNLLARLLAGDHPGWPHAEATVERLRGWAHGCERLLVLTAGQVARAAELLEVDPQRCSPLPNGVDVDAFRPGDEDRDAVWRPLLGEPPRGPVALAVGRFTAVKRLPLLIEAWAQARLPAGAALVLVGGYPGEVEGEHPAAAIERTGARGVHLAGWHDHDALPALLRACDLVVLASVREQFGAVLVEGFASGRPALAVDAFGPAEVVDDGRTGWLVPPDDREALSAALEASLGDPAELARRGRQARRVAEARFAWPARAGRLAATLRDVAALPAR